MGGMSDQNKLREILMRLRLGHVYEDQAEQAILEWVNEVIGEDESREYEVPSDDPLIASDRRIRSDLRAIQRKRAGL